MRFVLFSACLILAGCVGRSDFPALGADVTGTAATASNSRVGELTTGMTLAEASLIVGPSSGSADDPAMIGHTCFSHPYQGASGTLYVYTIYTGGNLTSASDGHTDMCSAADF